MSGNDKGFVISRNGVSLSPFLLCRCCTICVSHLEHQELRLGRYQLRARVVLVHLISVHTVNGTGRYGMIWYVYGMIWYVMVWYDVVWCCMAWYI